MSTPIGRFELVALDCRDHIGLARFYQSIVGGEISRASHDDWQELHTSNGVIAFQRVDDHEPPTWPGGDRPQQAHLDIRVDDLDVAEAAVLELGAVKVDEQPRPDDWRVFLDPAGHPFCLVRSSDESSAAADPAMVGDRKQDSMNEQATNVHERVLRKCQDVFPSWRSLTVDDIDFDDPKGFSSFTMGVRPRPSANQVEPPAVLYRQLAGKENAILDFDTERSTFLLLGEHHVAAHCYHYDDTCRIEAFYRGRTLTADDVLDPDIQRRVADQLFALHHLQPSGLPQPSFFELLHEQWGPMARHVLGDASGSFPADEQALCADLREIYSDDTLAKVRRCLPDRPTVFCHNDTYHGNVMLLDNGEIKLLDFEFSCRNHIAFDFANLFAETVMEHGLADPPHFRIAEPRFDDADLAHLIGCYLANGPLGRSERLTETDRLVTETRRCLMLSDYMYAMAGLPLALEPIQKLRFIPYSHQRFHKFLRTWDAEFG